MKKSFRSFLLVTVTAAWSGGMMNSDAQTYTLTDLGVVNGGTAQAAAINLNGQITGTATTASGVGYDAFLYSGGVQLDLGNLGGVSTGNALNDSGDVAGGSSLITVSTTNHPFLFKDDTLLDLGLPAGMKNGVAFGVNNSDQVVGQLTAGPRRQTVSFGFLWQNGVYMDLGTLGGSNTTALAINDAGQIVGSSATANGASDAFLWQNGVMTDLGTFPGGFGSSATAINDLGEIVGSSGTANFGPAHAFFRRNGVMTDLGVLPGFNSSSAAAVNNSAAVVGSCATVGYKTVRAFLYQNGVMTDLNRLIPGTAGSWILQSATGINDAGEIVGSGTTNGFQHAFLLTPATGPTVPAAPVGVATVSGNGLVTVNWQASVGAASYNVKRATSSAGPFATIATGLTATRFTDNAVVNCTTYYYAVSAVNSAGASPNSAAVLGNPQGIPAAPGNLTAARNTNPNLFLGSAINLAWRNNASTCSTAVQIERSTDGVHFALLVTLGSIQTSYTDGFLNSRTRYYYRVRAQSTGGLSGYSNIASAVAP